MKKDSLITEWNFDFLTDEEKNNPEKLWLEVEGAYKKFIDKWKARNDYVEKPEALKEALDEYEKLIAEYAYGGKLGYYFNLKGFQDQDNTEIKAINLKYDEKMKWLSNEIQFFGLKIAKIPENKQRVFLESPLLRDYKHFLEKSFMEAKHLLSESEEKIMTLKSSSGRWADMVDRLLSRETRKILDDDGKEKEKNFSEIMSLLSSTNKKTRDSAAEAFNGILKQLSIVAEEEINALMMDKKIDDELRKFPRPDSSRHLRDDMETEVVDALRRAVTENFDVSKKYYALKARLLGVKKLQYHERNVPYGNIGKKYSYEESIKLVEEVFKELDGELHEIFSNFVNQGRFDVYPRKGKADGAFCFHTAKNLPTYILLNHEGLLREVLTIAHESGHGINNEMIKKKQNAINFGTPTSTAECASTFMEDFVLEKMMGEADDELKLAIMMMKLNEDVSTIFRQIACYNFEWDLNKEVREKGFLSREEIGMLFKRHMSTYMGDAVEQSEGSENWWVYWGHIRRFFYVYTYVSGLLISKSMQNAVKKDKAFINKVKEFLSAGESDSPKNIFARMNIDITDEKFWDDGIGEVKQLLEKTEKLARKLGKIK